jgi:hypothetical protein
MNKCRECGEYTRSAYIRRMKAGISTWIPIGEFCPLCQNMYVTYEGDEIKGATKVFIEKMLELPRVLDVVEYLKENPPEKLDTIIELVPELKVAITTPVQKYDLIQSLISLKMIDKEVYDSTENLTLSSLVKHIIAHTEKAAKVNSKPQGDGSPHPLVPKNHVPDVIEI